jgi:site-specific DNA-methyltransferase (adenine-specific)
MGKKWDSSGIAYDVELWTECLRVLKPGGHLLAFSGSRTYHRMAVAIEDAGFDIRDQIQWVYGSGFPKSHDVSKAIDKMEGAESAKQYDGWGTALKPAHEPICVARKPLIGTVVENVLQYGTGGINIDGCRVGTPETWQRLKGVSTGLGGEYLRGKQEIPRFSNGLGRWPANFIHDGSEEVLQGFPSDEKQSASRFFYCAKASKKDRDEGLEGFEEREARSTNWSGDGMPLRQDGTERKQPIAQNHHPTVKPTSLMQYLCRLVTPPNGTILDPFLGSGSTGKAAMYEGFNFVGFDLNSEYIAIAKARIEFAIKNKNNTLFEHE